MQINSTTLVGKGYRTIKLNRYKRRVNIITGIGCGALLSCYLIQQYYYTPSLPFGDDLPVIFQFLFRFDEAPTWSEKIAILVNNRFAEHRLLSASCITLLTYLISGTVQLPVLTVIAGLCWVSSTLLYFKWLKKSALSTIWLIPILFVFLAAAPYQVIYWPMAALQHLVVVFLCFITLYFLSAEEKTSPRLILWAISFAFITTFSAGNGMAVWPAGLLVLGLRRDVKYSLIWFFCSVLSVTLYLWDLPRTGLPSDQAAKLLLTNALRKIIGFFAGLGSAIHTKSYESFLDDANYVFSLKYPSIYLGLLIVLLFGWAFRKTILNYDSRISPVLGCTVFIFISFAFIIWGRTPIDGEIVAFKSRYYPYSIVAICNAIFLMAFLTKATFWYKWLFTGSVICGATFWSIWQVVAYHKIYNHANLLQAGLFNWQHNGSWVVYQQTSYYENYFNAFFDEMKARHFPIQIPNTPLSQAFKNKKWTDHYFSELKQVQIQKINNYVHLNLRNEQAQAIRNVDEGYTMVMASERDTFLLWSVVSPTGIRNFFKTGQSCREGYRVEVALDQEKMPKGNYSLHQFYYSGNQGIINRKSESTIVF
ncbi:hypothetical protein [Larkinella knui]|uniref:Uncharacterized protein n=1 Tax=Larkinella knui TaxID=2025310 RepID=A0A3P1CL55_9BACT|nr:hypothetical protein [Larkinella knui]RRB14037.1 hypothetical protein EHT87_17490 [Larkinella knui]